MRRGDNFGSVTAKPPHLSPRRMTGSISEFLDQKLIEICKLLIHHVESFEISANLLWNLMLSQ